MRLRKKNNVTVANNVIILVNFLYFLCFSCSSLQLTPVKGKETDSEFDTVADSDPAGNIETEYQAPRNRQISVGLDYDCLLEKDGTVICWGRNDYGQASAPKGKFRQISANYYHSCGVKESGDIVCWGNNGMGQSKNQKGSYTQVAVGEYSSCAIKIDGSLKCWGNPNIIPPTGNYVQIDGGEGTFCAINQGIGAVCFGKDNIEIKDKILQITVGMYYDGPTGGRNSSIDICAIRDDRTVVCIQGGLGMVVPPPGRFVQISSGFNKTCGVKENSLIKCWEGILYGDRTYSVYGIEYTDIQGKYLHLEIGKNHYCAIDINDSIICEGDNSFGQSNSPYN
jgi:alpha-tubulin suppressor-like RCC1 family protein